MAANVTMVFTSASVAGARMMPGDAGMSAFCEA